MMITKNRKIKNGRIIIKSYTLGTLFVKKEFESHGKYYLVACKHEPNSKVNGSTSHYVLYAFNPIDGTSEYIEEFKHKTNSYRDACRSYQRYIKTINNEYLEENT